MPVNCPRDSSSLIFLFPVEMVMDEICIFLFHSNTLKLGPHILTHPRSLTSYPGASDGNSMMFLMKSFCGSSMRFKRNVLNVWVVHSGAPFWPSPAPVSPRPHSSPTHPICCSPGKPYLVQLPLWLYLLRKESALPPSPLSPRSLPETERTQLTTMDYSWWYKEEWVRTHTWTQSWACPKPPGSQGNKANKQNKRKKEKKERKGAAGWGEKTLDPIGVQNLTPGHSVEY